MPRLIDACGPTYGRGPALGQTIYPSIVHEMPDLFQPRSVGGGSAEIAIGQIVDERIQCVSDDRVPSSVQAAKQEGRPQEVDRLNHLAGLAADPRLGWATT